MIGVGALAAMEGAHRATLDMSTSDKPSAGRSPTFKTPGSGSLRSRRKLQLAAPSSTVASNSRWPVRSTRRPHRWPSCGPPRPREMSLMSCCSCMAATAIRTSSRSLANASPAGDVTCIARSIRRSTPAIEGKPMPLAIQPYADLLRNAHRFPAERRRRCRERAHSAALST